MFACRAWGVQGPCSTTVGPLTMGVTHLTLTSEGYSLMSVRVLGLQGFGIRALLAACLTASEQGAGLDSPGEGRATSKCCGLKKSPQSEGRSTAQGKGTRKNS